VIITLEQLWVLANEVEVPNIYIYSCTFGSKGNNILQLSIILNNEVSVLDIFFKFSAWQGSNFHFFLAIPLLLHSNFCDQVVVNIVRKDNRCF
jgi:hypothetical protein